MTDAFAFVIREAQVLDGGGGPPYRADVAVRGGRIAAVGQLGSVAAPTVDAAGLALAPGFIDMHSHSDVTLWQDPRGLSKLRQGITLEVTGNCGMTPAPITDLSRDAVRPPPGVEAFPWTDFAGFLAALDGSGPAVNVAPLVGHGTIRRAAMGDDDRPARPDELAAMQAHLAEAMAAGAFGMSSGLIYPPGAYAPTAELSALARTMSSDGGLYFSHIRSEGDRLLEAVTEAITIGAEGGVGVQLSHHKASGRRNWGRTEQSLALVEAARQRGGDVTLDVYPYVASATSLTALLPAWALAGGRAETARRLRDPDTWRQISAAVEAAEGDGGYGRTRLAGLRRPDLAACEGRTLEEAAGILGLSPLDALRRILLDEDLRTGMIRFGMDEADVRRVLAYPHTMIGTDGSAIAPDGAEGRHAVHPRTYGTFPRVLGRYVREQRVLELPEAIRRMTSLAADRLGLADRGRIAPGAWADLVLFDPERVEDLATWDEPHRYPAGILGVWVNGRRAVSAAGDTGVRAGRVLRRPGSPAARGAA
jgi:N-acyl-D-amino-acid deacylase